MFIGISNVISGIRTAGLSYIKDNLKLYLDFKSNRSDTLAFPSEGSTFFDNSNDYIAVSDNDSLDIGTGNVTVSAWVKPTDLDSNHTILDKRGSDQLGINFTIHSSDRFFFQISDGTNDYYDYAGTACTLGQWHHVCAVWNPNTTYAKFYLDGVDVGRQYSTTNANVGNSDNTSELRLGKSSDGYTAYPFGGKMANVAMWTRELSPEEVQSVMNKSYSQLSSVEKTSLVSWWAMDNTDYVGANVSTFMNSTGSSIGEWDLTDGIITVSSHNAYRYFNAYITSASYSGANAYIRIEVTAKKTSGSPVLEFKGVTTLGLTTEYQTYTIDVNYSEHSGDNFFRVPNASGTDKVLISSFNAYPFGSKDSHGSNNGVNSKTKATTSVYGGNAPVLPRAIDIAESQAEAIGNGSASFTIGNTDYIEIKDTGIVLQNWSISFWVRTGANLSGSFPGIVSTRSGTNNDYDDGVTLHYYSDYFDSEGASQTSHFLKVTGNTNLDNGEWHHVVFTSDRNGKNKQYINGIFITEENATDNPTNADIIQIGARFYSSAVKDFWDGDICQVGFWQGILSQSQVQEVYESTSYAKIPASVKSTLGSEKIVNGSFDTVSNGTTGYDNGDNTVDGYGNSNGAHLSISSNKLKVKRGSSDSLPGASQNTLSLISGRLYKMSADYDTTNCDGCKMYGDGTELVVSASEVGTLSMYYVAQGTGAREHYLVANCSSTDEFALFDNFSIKEVTNDLVAYYPLDADNSANGFTQDATTGETLSDELFTGSASSGNWTWDSSANTLTGVGTTNDAYSNILSGVAEGDIVKTTFDITGFTGGGFYLNLGGGGYPSFTPANGSFTVYTISGSGTQKLAFDGSAPFTGVLSNISAKKVTSKTGVLK